MQFCAATALATGRVDMACFEDGPVRDAATRELMSRVRMVVDRTLPHGPRAERLEPRDGALCATAGRWPRRREGPPAIPISR